MRVEGRNRNLACVIHIHLLGLVSVVIHGRKPHLVSCLFSLSLSLFFLPSSFFLFSFYFSVSVSTPATISALSILNAKSELEEHLLLHPTLMVIYHHCKNLLIINKIRKNTLVVSLFYFGF
jgi:hypothetical protein